MAESSGGVEKLENPGPGVPTGDQHPTNETEDSDRIAADVHIPGPYPSDADDTAGGSSEPEPTKESRDAASLGDVVEGSGAATPAAAAAAGGAGSSSYRALHEHDQPETPLEEAENVRAESFPGGVPEDSDVGTGRRKGQGLPPGSVDKDDDTPQTPAT